MRTLAGLFELVLLERHVEDEKKKKSFSIVKERVQDDNNKFIVDNEI